MTTLDTSALVRFFTNDEPRKALKVKAVMEGQKVKVPDVVLPELEYVLLGKIYNSTRENLVRGFEYLVNSKNINVSKEAKLGIEIYKTSRLDMADCIIISSAKSRNLLTFDDKMSEIHKNLK